MYPTITLVPSDTSLDTVKASYARDYKLHDPSNLRNYWLTRDENFDLDRTYTLVQTVGNPEADKVLRANKDTLEHRDYLSKHLLDSFHRYICHILQKDHCSFNTVRAGDLNHFSFPRTHVLVGSASEKTAEFRTLVDSLLSDTAHVYLQEREAPQNYNMPAIDLLREKNISPLIVKPRTSEMSGAQLKDFMDMLMPYEVARERTNWHEVD